MIGNRIAAIGLEVEGPFRSAVPIKDKVIEFKEEIMPATNHPEVAYYKECVSDVLRYNKHVTEFWDQVTPHWVSDAVGPGMGFHIHFSFNDERYYNIIFSKKFVDEFKKRLFSDFKDDRALMARPQYRSQQGTNFFVLDYPEDYFKFSIEKKQHGTDRKERYYIINFWRAYRDHKTFEVRIFPANTIEKMKAYTEWFINFVTDFIDRNMGDDVVECNNTCDVEVEVYEGGPQLTACGKSVVDDNVEVKKNW